MTPSLFWSRVPSRKEGTRMLQLHEEEASHDIVLERVMQGGSKVSCKACFEMVSLSLSPHIYKNQ
ncbi:unnamed protein product [Sphenostylis stenocarpa]|uniref:Uncharacterized protein n=1 Tax=Sphenostylis stenocarpa TaxID=92480 RepID=A0AA86SMR5_9FABA|nr:unnamed protein product [Sphenostylis stenocarpa]